MLARASATGCSLEPTALAPARRARRPPAPQARAPRRAGWLCATPRSLAAHEHALQARTSRGPREHARAPRTRRPREERPQASHHRFPQQPSDPIRPRAFGRLANRPRGYRYAPDCPVRARSYPAARSTRTWLLRRQLANCPAHPRRGIANRRPIRPSRQAATTLKPLGHRLSADPVPIRCVRRRPAPVDDVDEAYPEFGARCGSTRRHPYHQARCPRGAGIAKYGSTMRQAG